MKPGTAAKQALVMIGVAGMALFGAAVATPAAHAQTPAPEAFSARPSVFTYAGRGFLVGGMVGLSGGYLAARGNGFSSSDWQPLAYGTGIGALTGGALGLTLGILDTSRNTPGYGALILRDTVYGAGFGAVAGGIVGGLTAISSREPEHILLGASVGTLVGAVAGIVLGIVEGNRALERTGLASETPERFALGFTAVPALGDGAPLAWLPTFNGKY